MVVVVFGGKRAEFFHVARADADTRVVRLVDLELGSVEDDEVHQA